MGKYDYRENIRLMAEKYPEYSIEKYVNESSKLHFLSAIANELAEANRLKILKLKLQHEQMSVDDFLNELEDQA